MQGNLDLHPPRIKLTVKVDLVHPGWRSRPLYTSRWTPMLLRNWMKSHVLRRADEARWSMLYAFPAGVGIWKNAGWTRKTSVRFYSSHGWMFAALPDRSRDWEACKETQSSLPGPMARWHHGTLCHPMPHAWTHGPGFRLNLSGTWRGALTPLARPVISGSSPMGWLLWGRADITTAQIWTWHLNCES